jgi:hypothetical protein
MSSLKAFSTISSVNTCSLWSTSERI